MRVRIYIGAAAGALMGGLTGAVETISTVSRNPLIGVLQETAMALIIPGLLGSAILSGNVHAFSLAFAVVINTLLYFGVGWLSCFLWGRRKRFR
jgi:hypothetical protein